MTTWSSKTQPTPANIRKRIGAAQDAISGAIDLVKQNERLWTNKREAQSILQDLINANAWLQSAQRRLTKR